MKQIIRLLYFFHPESGQHVLEEGYVREFELSNPGVKVLWVNAGTNQELVDAFGIQGVPTFVFMSGEKLLTQADGVYTAQHLKEMLVESVAKYSTS